MSKDAKEQAEEIQRHIPGIIDVIHDTLEKAGIDGVKVHAIQFKAAPNKGRKQKLSAGCVLLPDGTIHCG